MSGFRTPVALLGLAALVALSGVIVRVVTADAKGCSKGPRLPIVAAPAIVSALQEATDRWQRSRAGGECVRVQISPVAPAEVVETLTARSAGQAVSSGADQAVVWIPDSAAWLDRVRALEPNALVADTPSIAMSPVTLAAPEALVQSLAPGGKQLSPGDLGNLLDRVMNDADNDKGLKVGSVEPRRDGAGLAGATMLHDAVASSPERLVDLVGLYRGVTVMSDVTALTSSFGKNMIAPMSEQSVLAFDATSPAAPLGVMPVEPAIALDYPYAIISGQATGITRVAEELRTALTGQEYLDMFGKHGFRSATGGIAPTFPAGHGATAPQVAVHPLADAAKVSLVLGYWTATKTPARMLTLFDVTSSTTAPVTRGGTTRRVDLMRKAATGSLALLGDDSVSGLWTYSAGAGTASSHREIEPVRPLGASQRSRLQEGYANAQLATTDTCALHETVLDAYRVMRDGYYEGAPNTILVLTDGGNTKPGISRAQLRAELEKLADPARPIRVVLMGFGPDVDVAGLTAIAEVTGGTAVRITDVSQIKAATATVLFGP